MVQSVKLMVLKDPARAILLALMIAILAYGAWEWMHVVKR
jgi:hypothetical protein